MKFIKTLAFTSLVAFSTIAFTACGEKKAEGTTEDTEIIIEEDIIDETVVDDASNMMEAQDTTGIEVMTEEGGN